MNDLIKNTYIFGTDESATEKNECLNVIYGVDENYQFGAGVSAVSLLINNPESHFRFHFFLDTITKEFTDKLHSVCEKFSTEIIVYELNGKNLKNLPASDIWSSAMYFRLIALDYLSDSYDYALYLDADVICCNKFNLSNKKLEEEHAICGVVLDDITVRSKSGARLNVEKLNDHYFNSGVMFINLKQWTREKITLRCFELLSQPNSKELYKYPDQDVLNILLVDKQVQLNKRFNTIYSLKNELYDSSHEKYKKIITNDTVFIHYTGVTKPWHTWASYPSSQPFYRAFECSPWTLCDLKSVTKFVENKKEYKHLLKQKKFIKGSISGMKYLFKKFIQKKN